jgi:hypothetical protein
MNALNLALILLVLATMPSAAGADGEPQPALSPPVSSPPAVPPDGPDPAIMQSMELRMRAQMEAMLAQMRTAQLELRRDVLGVLTSQQRAFVATTIGELAVSAQRDDAGAAGRIDASLSPAQRQAILRIVSTNMTRRAAELQNMVQQDQRSPAGLPPLAQHIPSQPAPPQLETRVEAAPIAAGISVSYGPYGAAGQTSAGGAILSVLEIPVPQLFTPPVMMVQPH